MQARNWPTSFIIVFMSCFLIACGEKAAENTNSSSTANASGSAPTNYDYSDPELIAQGERLYMLCNACHHPTADGPRKIGPHLEGLLDRKVASIDNFPYSQALSGLNKKWDQALLDDWLRAPQEVAPGNMMAFAGLKDEQKRAAILAYLMTL